MLETLVTEKRVKESIEFKIDDNSYGVIKNGFCFINIFSTFDTVNAWSYLGYLPDGIRPANERALYFTANLNVPDPTAGAATIMVGGVGNIQYICGKRGQYIGSIQFPIKETT